MKLRAASLVDLLPDSVKNDPDVNAIARAVDPYLWDTQDTIQNELIWSRISQLDEPLLSNLARQMGITAYDGWLSANTLDQKRQLVQIGYLVHFYRGTRYAMEKVFDILGATGKITEWWETDDPTFKPYEFEISISVLQTIDPSFWDNVSNIVNTLKNERSWLRPISMGLDVKPVTLYAASATLILANTTVYPGT